MIKVHNGTRADGPALCRTCRNATILKGSAINQEVVYCGSLGEYLKFEPVECSSYDDKNQPSLHAMREIAHILNVTKSGRVIGFLSADTYRDKYGSPTLPYDVDY